jgi:hypothetical protein
MYAALAQRELGAAAPDLGAQGEHLAQVRVPDEGHVRELLEHREALTRLLGREDVLELLEPHGRAVAEVRSCR